MPDAGDRSIAMGLDGGAEEAQKIAFTNRPAARAALERAALIHVAGSAMTDGNCRTRVREPRASSHAPLKMFATTIARLENALRQPLPGPRAQDLLTPLARRDWPPGFNPARVRHAAGLLLVFPIGDRPHLVLTRRADRVRHGGQVSLPGGVVEPGETFEQAALREAREEVDLQSEDVRILGALTPVDIPVSGFRLHPIVGAGATRPTLRPCDAEVAQILEVAIDDLLDPRRVTRQPVTRDGRTFEVPALVLAAGGGATIWGATAMVLAEFLALLGWPTEPETLESQLS